MKLDNLTFGLLLSIEAISNPGATLSRLRQASLPSSHLLWKICFPTLAISLCLGMIGVIKWGVPTSYWQYENFQNYSDILIIFRLSLPALILCAVLLVLEKKQGDRAADMKRQLFLQLVVAVLILSTGNILFLFPWVGHLNFLFFFLAIEVLLFPGTALKTYR